MQRDNLYRFRADAQGSEDVHARRTSLTLQVQKLLAPVIKLALLAAGIALTQAMLRRRGGR